MYNSIILFLVIYRNAEEKMKKNVYFFSYFPLIATLLFSMAFSLYSFELLTNEAKKIGLYQGLSEYVSTTNLNMALFFVLCVALMMILSLLKLLGDTFIKLSLLFFSKDREGLYLNISQSASVIFAVGGLVALVASSNILLLLSCLIISTIGYFGFVLYKMSSKLTMYGMAGVISFQVGIWSAIGVATYLLVIKILTYAINQLVSI
jgi:hypothetical protein